MQSRLGDGDGCRSGRATVAVSSLLGEGVEQPVGGPRHGGDGGDAQPFVDRGALGVVDPCNHPRNPEHLARHPRRDDVGVVARGHRGEGVGPLDSGAQQHVPVESHAQDAFAGEVGGEPVERGRVAVDDRHLVSEPGQRLGQRGADPAASHHHYPHLRSFRLICVSAQGRAVRYGERYRHRRQRLLLALVSKVSTGVRRLLLGQPFRSDRLSRTLLPKRIALPVFASDAMSSVAYAPEEIFLVLSVAGVSAYVMAPWIGVAVAVVMLVVVASYRQNVHAYPSGGGDYEVVTTNLGPNAGLTVASALLVDYVLTVAVSMASAMSNIGSAVPFVAEHKVAFAVTAIVLLTAVNLRGIRESGTAFAVPTYAFMFGMLAMLGWGFIQIHVLGHELRAESAEFELQAEYGDIASFALVFLVARAFSSGCAALTGVEAISNGVPAFRKPKSRNAATTLALLGGIAITLFVGMILLAVDTGVKVAERPAEQLIGAPADYQQKTLLAQLADAVFHDFAPGMYLIVGVTALILVLAANTAFNGFPVLGSILAQDRYLPRQLHTRGDRLAFSNGIVFLALAAVAFVIAFDADVTALIQLYIVGVFISFTLSQIGHGAALEQAAADRGRPRGTPPDDPLTDDQHRRAPRDRDSAARCAGHQVHIRGVDRHRGHERSVRDDEGHQPALQQGVA